MLGGHGSDVGGIIFCLCLYILHRIVDQLLKDQLPDNAKPTDQQQPVLGDSVRANLLTAKEALDQYFSKGGAERPTLAQLDNRLSGSLTHLVTDSVDDALDQRFSSPGTSARVAKSAGRPASPAPPEAKPNSKSSAGGAASEDSSKSRTLQSLAEAQKQWADEAPAFEDDTIRCYHQPLGGSMHAFKYEVTMESAPGPVVAVARELDLMPSWHKFVTQACLVEDIPGSDTSFGGLWGYVEVWFPWPLSNRAMVVRCETLDVLEETDSIVVKLESGEYDESKLPTTSAQCPRLWAKNLTQIVPLAPTAEGKPRTQFILFCETDFQTPLMPRFVVNFILKVMAPVVYAQVKTLLESSFGGNSQFRKRMAECPQLYDTLACRVDEHVATKFDGVVATTGDVGTALGGAAEQAARAGSKALSPTSRSRTPRALPRRQSLRLRSLDNQPPMARVASATDLSSLAAADAPQPSSSSSTPDKRARLLQGSQSHSMQFAGGSRDDQSFGAAEPSPGKLVRVASESQLRLRVVGRRPVVRRPVARAPRRLPSVVEA